MKKLLIKSTIAAFAIEIIGAAVNLISYAVNGRFLLAKQLVGGEWMGWSGFGMLLNRTFPMSSQDHPVSGSTWISFDPGRSGEFSNDSFGRVCYKLHLFWNYKLGQEETVIRGGVTR